MRTIFSFVVAIAVAATFSATSYAQVLISNDTGNGGFDTDLSGWLPNIGVTVHDNDDGDASALTTAPFGPDELGDGTGGSLHSAPSSAGELGAQSFKTVSENSVLNLSFDLRGANGGTDGVNVNIVTTGGLNFNQNFAAVNNVWEQHDITTTVGAGQGGLLTLRFSSVSADDYNIDRVYLEAVPVPEPSSLAVLGLAGLGFVARRRR